VNKRIAGSLILHRLWWYINTIPCKECGSRLWFKSNEVQLDGIECEYECDCSECGEPINYFAYGYYQFAFTRTEAVGNFIYRVKYRLSDWKMKRDLRNGKF
jgi:hypothetical protein